MAAASGRRSGPRRAWQLVQGVLSVRGAGQREAGERERLVEAERAARSALEQPHAQLAHVHAITELGLLHLSLDDLLSGLLQRVRELVGAERAAILLLEEQGRTLTVRATIGIEEDVELTLQFPSGEDFFDLVRGSRGEGEAHARAIASSPARAYMREGSGYFVAIPLFGAAGRLAGVLQVSSDGQDALDEDQLRLLELIAERAALAIERAALPERMPLTPGLAVAARYLPGTEEAEVGGDWYDVFPVGDRVCIAIGDVVGKGLLAASEMGQLRNAFRAFALEGFGPASILERLSRLARLTNAGEHSTAICISLDPATGSLSLASAGHLPPLVVHRDGSAEFLTGGRSLPLGAVSPQAFRRATYRLLPGERLVLYTDGLVERRGRGIDVGLQQLAAAAASGPRESELLADHILELLVDRRGRDDDIGLIVARLLPAAIEPLRLKLSADPSSLTVLRAELRRWLVAAELSTTEAYEVLIAANEAAANAVEHPRSPTHDEIEVTATCTDETVEIVVRDTGDWQPQQERSGRGLGLSIIRRVMDDVLVEPSAAGTVVRMRHRIVGPDIAA